MLSRLRGAGSSSKEALRLACESVQRVVSETTQFHSTAAGTNNAFDALALEDALLLERQESGKLAHFMMQLETHALTSAKRVRGTVLVGSTAGSAIDQALLQASHKQEVRWRGSYGEFMDESIRKLFAFRSNEQLALRDPIPYLVHEIAHKRKLQLLIIEQVRVSSLVDAMLLRRLFKGLFGYGIGIVLTSEQHPNNWYMHGVNAHKLDAFKLLLASECELVQNL